jgi:cytochrome P450
MARANVMYFTLAELALQPEVQDELYKEVQSVCGGRLPEYADIPNLIYTQCVMYETMRLHPIIGSLWLQVAGSSDETLLGKYPIPKSSTVGMDLYNLHRNEKYWGSDADKFIPSRFDNRQAGSHDSEAYCPDGKFKMPVRDAFFGFGDGPRACLGIAYPLNA